MLTICAVTLLLCTGCPEPPTVSRSVVLGFPSQVPSNARVVSVTNEEVMEALRVVDGSLVSHGFVRAAYPPEASVGGFVASYSRRGTNGLIRFGDAPSVEIRQDELIVVFSNGKTPSGRLTLETKTNVDLIRKALTDHFGSKRVSVQR
jgi:hypothetical protein